MAIAAILAPAVLGLGCIGSPERCNDCLPNGSGGSAADAATQDRDQDRGDAGAIDLLTPGDQRDGLGDTALADSGRTDSGVDAGRADTGSPDVPRTDSGPADTGRTDTGRADTGPADTGSPADAGGSPDSGPPDAGPADSGAPTDAGPPDSGPPDAGSMDSGLATGLLALYAFDDTTGTAAVDSSGNGHDGTLVGGATLGQAGMIGGDVSFNGSDGYVELPDALLDGTFDVTIAVWVKVRNDHSWQRVLDFSGGNGMTTYMNVTPHATTAGLPQALRFSISNGGSTTEQRLTGTTQLPTGVWQHVAIVLDAVGGTLYLNGAALMTSTTLKLRPADIRPTTNVWLGRSPYTQDPYFDGELDEVRIYNRALSATEISALSSLR